MNENHSENEFFYKPRWIAPLLRQAAEDHPVVILTGARQVGKSTLLKHEDPFSRWRYLTLDNYDILGQANSDPNALWAGTDRVIIDEVQKSTTLLSAVKEAVDQSGKKIRFILSGSANIALMQRVTESLAGRAVHMTLLPLTWGGIVGSPPFASRRRPLFRSLSRRAPTTGEGAVYFSAHGSGIFSLHRFSVLALGCSRVVGGIRLHLS